MSARKTLARRISGETSKTRLSSGEPRKRSYIFSQDFRGAFGDFVDATIANAWRKAGLTGAAFTPLQSPTEDDFEGMKDNQDCFYFNNRPHWDQRAVLS